MSCLGVNCFVEFYEPFMYRFRNGNKKSFGCLPQICLDFNVVYDKNISRAYSTHSAAKSIKVCFFLCHLIISMKNKSLSFVAFLLMISVVSIAQELRFRTDSTFRIVQFTDIHYKAGAEPSKKSVSMMRATLDDVKPDLVVFTGDVVVSAPTKQGWDEVLDLVISKKIPYLVTFGNHDDENEMKRAEVAAYVAGKPYLLNKTAEIKAITQIQEDSVSRISSRFCSISYYRDLPKITLGCSLPKRSMAIIHCRAEFARVLQ